MKVKFEIPVKARARFERRDVVAFVKMEHWIDIEPENPLHYPIAVDFTSQVVTQNRMYRYDSDTDLLLENRGSVGRHGEYRPAKRPDYGLWHDVLYELRESHEQAFKDAASDGVLYPEPERHEASFSFAFWFDLSEMPLTSVNGHDLEECRRGAEAAVAQFRLVDGVFWSEVVDEPVIRVRRTNGRWTTEIVHHVTQDAREDARSFYFAIDEIESAVGWARFLSEEVADRPVVEVSLETPSGYQSTRHVRAESLQALASYVAQRLINRGRDITLDRQPTDVIGEYVNLRRFRELDPAMIDDRHVDGLFASFDSLMAADAEGRIRAGERDYGYTTWHQIKELAPVMELHRKHWESRQINLGDVPAVSHGPKV